jgi:hypothetical protein
MQGKPTGRITTGSSLMLALGLWLGAGSSLSAQSLFEGSEADANPWRVRIEVFSLGFSIAHSEPGPGRSNFGWHWDASTLFQAHAERGRWRFGTAASEAIMGFELVNSYAPLRLDYVVWERPLWYVGPVHAMLPELTLHFSGYWLNQTLWEYERIPIAGRLDAIAGVDILGLGVSVSAGVIAARTMERYNGRDWVSHTVFSPNVEVRLRALTFGLDLAER